MSTEPKPISIPTTMNPQIADSYNYAPAKRGRPFLFTVTEPNSTLPLYNVALALHANPESVEERMQKNKTNNMTYAGFVEYVWPDELNSISANGSTGGFIAPSVGLTAGRADSEEASARSKTIAYEKFQDLLDLFHNNGIVFDGKGVPAIRGRVIMIYDRGIFIGHFTSFEVTEENNKAFSFALNWEFKVEKSYYKFQGGRIS